MPTVLMEATFKSVARVTPRRGRVARDVEVAYRLPMLIEEVVASDLIVCANLASNAIAAWGGKLWMRMVSADRSGRSVGALVDVDFLQSIFDGREKASGQTFAAAPKELDWQAFQKVECDGLAAAELAAGRCAANFLICDGRVWAQSSMPDLTLAFGSRFVSLNVGAAAGMRSVLAFRFDEYAVAASIGRDVANKIGVTLKDDGATLVIVRPDLVPLAMQDRDIPSEFTDVPGRFLESLTHLKAEDMKHWLDFRVACETNLPVAACLALLDLTTSILERAGSCKDCGRLAVEFATFTVALALWASHYWPGDASELIEISEQLEWKSPAQAA